MNKVRLELNDKSFLRELPSEWNELSKVQLLHLAPLVLSSKASIEVLREIAVHFLDLPSNLYKEMNLSQLDPIAKSFLPFWKTNNLTVQLLPVVRSSPFQKLIGPAAGLQNTSAAEWAFADTYLNSFLKTQNEKDLNMLIACLYRPAGTKIKTDDAREDFDLTKIEKNMLLTARFSFEVKLAIAVFFIGCRNQIIQKFKPVFSGTNAKKADKSGWLGFFYDLAGPKTGTYHQVSTYNIYELMGILQKLIMDDEELKRKNKFKK